MNYDTYSGVDRYRDPEHSPPGLARELTLYLRDASPRTLAIMAGALAAELTARGIIGPADLGQWQARLEARCD